jgi:cytochrome c556
LAAAILRSIDTERTEEPFMTPKTMAALALAGLLAFVPAVAVLADTAADQAVSARQAAMKMDGRVLRGASNFTGDKAIAALTTVRDNYSKLPSLFPKDSITDKSIALPVIWEQFDHFSGIFKKGAAAAEEGIAAVKAGDMAKYKAAVKTIADTCTECHTTYRGEL